MEHQETTLYQRGAQIGAAVYFIFFVYCASAHFGFSILGVSAPELTELAKNYLLGPIALSQLRVLAFYLAIGALVGAGAGACVEAFYDLGQRKPGDEITVYTDRGEYT